MNKALWLLLLVAVVVTVAVVLRIRSPQSLTNQPVAGADSITLLDQSPQRQADEPHQPADAKIKQEPSVRATESVQTPAPEENAVLTPVEPAIPARSTASYMTEPVNVIIDSPGTATSADEVQSQQTASSGGRASRPVISDSLRAAPVDDVATETVREIDESRASTDPLDALTVDEILMHDPPAMTASPPPPLPAIPPGAVHIGRGSPGWSHQAYRQPPGYPATNPGRATR